MGAAPMAHTLWTRHLRFNPRNPGWANRDRFVLSAGHGSMLLYALLHLTGYDLQLEEIRRFRQWGSITPGHPENTLTPGVEMATGPLGQGFATAVGMAMAERFLGATFNLPELPVIDHHTYEICSDGDLMEGISSEAASFAGHQGLGKLIVLYDDNGITIDGSTSLAFTEDVSARFQAYGWQTVHVDGMCVDEVDGALTAAKAETARPSLILAKTVIGFGSPHRAGTAKVHGEALGEEEVRLTKDALGIPQEPLFFVPDAVRAEYGQAVERGVSWESDWLERMEAFSSAAPERHRALQDALAGKMPSNWPAVLPVIDDALASRASSGRVLNGIGAAFPTLIGGSADLTGSVNSTFLGCELMQVDNPGGRNVAYGVREHATAAAINGMTLHGGVRAFAGTFLMFSDYCRPALRLAALMECPSIFVFTHDSIFLGEDGPTHQPIEHLASLRAIPNFNVLRPADGHEVAACWKVALESKHTPCALILSRQSLQCLTPEPSDRGDGTVHPAESGAYILREASSGVARCILVATGSEVGIAVDARDELEAQGVPTRVVSMPSWFRFEAQPEAYRQRVLPRDVPTLSVEAGSTLGWARYANRHVGLDRFGASAPAPDLAKQFGFTGSKVAHKALEMLRLPTV